MNIFVGNLSHSATETALRTAFEKHGEVSRVNIPTDRETSQPRGFGFIEMPKANEARAAMTALNGAELMGRALTVSEARPRGDSSSGRNGNSHSGNREGANRSRDMYGRS